MCIVCLPPSLAVAAPWRCQPSTMKCVSCALTPITCCCCTMTLPTEYYEMCIVCAYPHHLLLLHHDVASRVLWNVYRVCLPPSLAVPWRCQPSTMKCVSCVLTPITCCCCTMTLPAEYYEMCIVCAYPHHLLLLHHDVASQVLWNVYRVCLPPSLAVAAPWRCQPSTVKCVSCVLTPITCCCCTMTLPAEYCEMCIVCAYPHHLLLLHHDVAGRVLCNVYAYPHHLLLLHHDVASRVLRGRLTHHVHRLVCWCLECPLRLHTLLISPKIWLKRIKFNNEWMSTDTGMHWTLQG